MSRMLTTCLGIGLCLSPTTGAENRTTLYSYTPAGRIASIDGPRTDVLDVTLFSYDTAGNLAEMKNALGHSTMYEKYDASGRLLWMIDPNGLETRLTYHPRGWIESHSVIGDGSIATTSYEYDATGNPVRISMPRGGQLELSYDTASRLTAITDSEGNKQRYTLDNKGNRVAEEFRDRENTLTLSLGRVYDALNRLKKLLGADGGHKTTIGYDENGNVTSLTDGLERTTSFAHDALDRLVHMLDAAGGETYFIYDSRDNLTKVVDPKGNATRYAYNAFDETTSQVSPDTGSTSYSYDEAGNPTSITDARGMTVNYVYDALNRVTSIHYSDPGLDVTFTYDQGVYGIGRLTGMTDATGSTEYWYDQRGNLVRETRRDGDHELVTHYERDSVSALTTLTYPSGHKVHYEYDDYGQPVSASLERPDGSLQNLVERLAYLPFGPVSATDYGNGLQLTRAFDQDYRLIHQEVARISSMSFEFDSADNIVAWSDLLDPSRDQIFGYDALDRLQSAIGPFGTLAFRYDAIGNRLSTQLDQATEHYLYASEGSQLLEIVGSLANVFTYDLAGNMTTSAKGEFSHDATGRLSSYTSFNVDATYAYNGIGQRVRKTVNGETTRFHYIGSLLLGEYSDSGGLVREYIYLDGHPVGVIEASSRSLAAATILQKVSTGHDWTSVALGDFGERPVIIAGPPTTNDRQAGVVAIRNLSPQRLDLSIREWNYLDGRHANEDFSVLAMPPGRFPQADGSVWEFGRATVSGTKNWHTVEFDAPFADAPAIFVTVQTANGAETVTPRVREVTRGSFEIALFEEERSENRHSVEEIGYLAIHSPGGLGTGSAKLSGTTIDYQLHSGELNERSTVIAGAALALQEEQSLDRETNHPLEQVNVLRVGGHIFAQDVTSEGEDTVAIRTTTVLPGMSYQSRSGNNDVSNLYFVHSDHLGAPIKLTDTNGTLVWDANRLPFGNLEMVIAEVALPLRFPGQYFDDESRLYYNYYRDYDPGTGRYIQSDPIGLEGGLNTYAYAGGNPLNWVDPFGLAHRKHGGGGSGIGAGGGNIWGHGGYRGSFSGAFSKTKSPALKGSSYNPKIVRDRIRPAYATNPSHNPKSPYYNPNKTPEPSDACSVYRESVRSGMGTWYGLGKNNDVYRFFSDNAGGAHFSGIVPKSSVPIDVQRQIGLR